MLPKQVTRDFQFMGLLFGESRLPPFALLEGSLQSLEQVEPLRSRELPSKPFLDAQAISFELLEGRQPGCSLQLGPSMDVLVAGPTPLGVLESRH